MRIKPWVGILVALLISVSLYGCGQAWKINAQSFLNSDHPVCLNLVDDRKLRVAVLPFNAAASTPAGDHISELFRAELVDIPFFQPVDQQKLMSLLKNQTLNPTSPEDVAEAIAIGRSVKAEAVILGHVTAYRRQTDKPASENFGLVLRMVDTQSGGVIWSASHFLSAVPVNQPLQMDNLVLFTIQQGVDDLRNQLTVAKNTRRQASSHPPVVATADQEQDQTKDELPEPAVIPPKPVPLKKIQSRLDRLGFKPGPIDGIYGAKTRRAIQRFQKKHHLVPDGAVSVFLLEALDQAISNPSEMSDP